MMIPQNTDFYTIQIKEIALHLLAEKDICPRFEILNKNPKITKWTRFLPPQNEAQTRAHFIKKQKEFRNSESVVWSIFYEKKLIGTIGLEEIFWKTKAFRKDSAVLGYWLSPEAQGKGVMTKVVKAIIAFGFEKLHLHQIYAACVTQNVGSAKVLEKSGFRLVGIFEKFRYKNEKWWDSQQYQLLKSNWETL